MNLLMHICCAPCAVYPLRILRSHGHKIVGLFYNPNIHPYLEYKKRFDTLKTYAAHEGVPLSFTEDYPFEVFIRNVSCREADRCRYCYNDRLTYTARLAKSGNFDGFTTTLLYSKYQNHEMVRDIGKRLANEHKITFCYIDFREGWEEGIRRSKELGLYRQPYCGCIYSEKERFYNMV